MLFGLHVHSLLKEIEILFGCNAVGVCMKVRTVVCSRLQGQAVCGHS